MACGRQLEWSDMIPVVSWVALRGRCRSCKSRISVQYPLVEATTAVLFSIIGYWVSGSTFAVPWHGVLLIAVSLCILALLVAIAAYDMMHTIIPDGWSYTFTALAFVFQLLAPFSGESGFAWLVLSGPVAASPLFALWVVSRGTWMGLGDAKLALGIGFLLGPLYGLFAVFFAFIIGAVVSVPLILLSSAQWKTFVERFTPTPISRRAVLGFTMKSEIPFGPFLITACLLVWFALLFNVPIPFFPMI